VPTLTVQPASGGKLITRAAAADAGSPHYTAKSNWRRDLTDSIIREGHDYFFPLGHKDDYLLHPFPGTTQPLTLVHMLRRPNGESALVVGTKTTLWRFRFDLAGYYYDEQFPVYAEGVADGELIDGGPAREVQPYFAEVARWQIIGDGFASNGNRWETSEIDGTLTLNNGVDLPVAYRVEWEYVVPLYELREQGVVCVGTISDTDGILMCADITELQEGDFDKILGVQDSATLNPPVTVSLSGYVLTASSAFFTQAMVGQSITWKDGRVRRIVAYTSATQAKTDDDTPLTSGTVYYENPYAYAGRNQLEDAGVISFNRRQYRVIWSELNNPMGWAITYPVSFTAGSDVFTFTTASRSLEPQDGVAVSGAGVNGGVLVGASVVTTGPGITILDMDAATSGTGFMQKSDSIGSISGYEDLQDDGSGILKMAPLAGRLVIYKDTNIFIGKFTGDVQRPFLFERIVVPHGRSLYYRHTLSNLQDVNHVYAGRDRFYSFNLTQRQPQPIPDADLCQNIFYDVARIKDVNNNRTSENIYACDNHVTQELWIVCPGAPTLCYDYLYSTFSTTDISPASGKTVKSANEPVIPESGEWFLMGWFNGTVIMYGLSTEPVEDWDLAVNPTSENSWRDGKRIYYRRSANPYSETKNSYSALLTSGMMHFGTMHNEKHLERYTLGLSSQPQVEGTGLPKLTATFYYAVNQNAEAGLLGSVEITDAELHGMIPLHCTTHYFWDSLSLTVLDNPVRLHNRTFDFSIIGSKSHHRNQT